MAKHPLHLKYSFSISSAVEVLIFFALVQWVYFWAYHLAPRFQHHSQPQIMFSNIKRPLFHFFERNERDSICKKFKLTLRASVPHSRESPLFLFLLHPLLDHMALEIICQLPGYTILGLNMRVFIQNSFEIQFILSGRCLDSSKILKETLGSKVGQRIAFTLQQVEARKRYSNISQSTKFRLRHFSPSLRRHTTFPLTSERY
jgi:hypothetical protein